MLSGFATPNDTLNFAKKLGAHSENYKVIERLTLSNVGMGTYLGNPDSQTDIQVENAIKKSILAGINVIDTAINYRAQKAERSVGKSIRELVESGKIKREELFLSTKNGYVTNDADVKEEFWSYINRAYVQSGIISSGDISSGYHCMTVPYLEDQLNRSLKNLGMDCVDLIYLHNAVEGQIQDIPMMRFLKNLRDVFELYEKKRKEGIIQFYGMATWECFRVPENNSQHLSLIEVLKIAKDVGGSEHGFRFVQLPFNMYLDQALLLKNQKFDGKELSFLELASKVNLHVFTSVPLMQGKLLSPGVMPEFGNLIPSLRTLQFIRSSPGVTAPLVGHKQETHVDENLEIMRLPPMSEAEFLALIKKLTV